MDFDVVQYDPDNGTSPSELARDLITETVTPYIELENRGFVKGLRIIVSGSLVNKLKAPNDYDLTILFEDFLPKGKKSGEDLSSEAKSAMDRLTQVSDDQYSQFTDVYQVPKTDLPYADRADIDITSVHNFLNHLNENDDEKKKIVLQELFRHTEVIYRIAVPDDRILDSDPGIDYETIDQVVLFSLLTAMGFDYKLTEDDFKIITRYSRDFRFPEKASYSEKLRLSEEYLENNIQKVIGDKDQLKVYKNSFGIDQIKTLSVLGSATTSFINNANLSNKFRDRILWIFGMLKNNLNGEEILSQDGYLVYGDSIENKGKPVFKEDKRFLRSI